jgi:hypothetical protein
VWANGIELGDLDGRHLAAAGKAAKRLAKPSTPNSERAPSRGIRRKTDRTDRPYGLSATGCAL